MFLAFDPPVLKVLHFVLESKSILGLPPKEMLHG